MTRFAKIIFCLSLLSCTTGCCYRMPEPDEFSLVPSTNNPCYTREKGSQTPGINY